jgi:hypothetical protein
MKEFILSMLFIAGVYTVIITGLVLWMRAQKKKDRNYPSASND